MSSGYIYLFYGISIISIGVFIPIYKNIDSLNNQLDIFITKKKAEKIIKKVFDEEKKKNKNITLDELILKFENTEETNLEIYAQLKNRDADSYRKIYGKYN